MKVERCFEFYQLTEVEKIEAAGVGMDGDALLWYQWKNKRTAVTSWKMLKRMMLLTFQGEARIINQTMAQG